VTEPPANTPTNPYFVIALLLEFDAEFFGKLITGRLCQRGAIRPDNGGDTAVAMVETLNIFGSLFILINVNPMIGDMMLVKKETRPTGAATPGITI
jgi:hypothetical protein